MSPRRRLDAELVRRNLAGSRQQAQELIAAGRVTVGGAPALKAARQVAPDEPLLVAGEPARFVSRGGEKLDAALERFDLGGAVVGGRALDAGASTGGFTDCLLQRGAAHVVAVDVGYGQLHERLRADPRVDARDRTNIREVDPADLGSPFDVVVADLSFISLRLVVDVLLAAATPTTADAGRGPGRGGHLVLLVKPQFEAGRQVVSRGRGVVRDPEVWRSVLGDVIDTLRGRGAAIMDGMVSPLLGAEGNVEFLLHARAPDTAPGAGYAPASSPVDVDALVSEATARRGGGGGTG
jgi:23S rRNA (cytidine1920-2'-O)/16S rRNA (cytidine1409-2'-O)-methyltransferase